MGERFFEEPLSEVDRNWLLELFREEIRKIIEKAQERKRESGNDYVDAETIIHIDTNNLQKPEMDIWEGFKNALQELGNAIYDLNKDSFEDKVVVLSNIKDRLEKIALKISKGDTKSNKFLDWMNGKITPLLNDVSIILSKGFPFEKKGVESIKEDVKKAVDTYVK